MKNSIDQKTGMACKAWPFEEAKKVLNRLRALNKGEVKTPEKGYVLFETGYGPSGLPHIGTFGEVCRTTYVMNAFKVIAPDIPVKMICFSDDMDGLRKVPDNVPNKDIIKPFVEQKDENGQIIRDPTPLTSVEDPFGGSKSFAHHNNASLCEFLDRFGFDYEFYSATETYMSGKFNFGLCKILSKWEEIREVVGSILGEERKKTYCPLFPIIDLTPELISEYGIDDCPRKIILHNVKLLGGELDKGIADFEVLHGPLKGMKLESHSVLNGGAKAQWRADWALRWFALDVDYEMAGVDLRSSAEISGKITQILGSRRPAGFHYELFLDEKGEKISKSKGNGLSIEEWLTYAPHESLAYYMYQRPSSAKKLYFDIIPKAVEEYMALAKSLEEQEDNKKLENAVWYIHGGDVPEAAKTPVTFAMLLNLASAANTRDPSVLWGFIQTYNADATPENSPFLDRLVGYAIKYYEDFVLPEKTYRQPDERERKALDALASALESMDDGLEAEEYMSEVFTAGKENGYDKSELRDWFAAIYQVVLGQDQGPRFGSFIAVYGPANTASLLRDALNGKFLKKAA